MNCAYCDEDLGPYPREHVTDADGSDENQFVKWTWSEGLGQTSSLYFCDPGCFGREVFGE